MFTLSNDDLKDALRNAEAEMLKRARGFDEGDVECEIEIIETTIPRSVVPLKPNRRDGNELTIHAVRVTSKSNDKNLAKTPLVLQHGYMNASCFFYCNLVGLSRQFETIYSIDMLGWGLSSRPVFDLEQDSVECAQDFFVESLEAWRAKIGIDKMILAGHSMGGYLSVAYCERYPQHVERLVLISPVGVPEETEDIRSRRKKRFSSLRRLAFDAYSVFFDNPCSMIRMLPRYKGRQYMMSYVKNRLPAIDDPDEQAAFAEYLYLNCVLPISGAQCLNYVLNRFAYARTPLLHRIPSLEVADVSFLYGSEDWMDYKAALNVYRICQEREQQGAPSPTIKVYKVPEAGHLLMLDNWRCFNATLVAACERDVDSFAADSSSIHVSGIEELTSKLNGDGVLESTSSIPMPSAAPQVLYS